MKNWVFRAAPADAPPESWADQLSISPFLLGMLWRRGLRSRESIERFLSARLADLTPPSAWPQMPQAADVLCAAIIAGKKPLIWGDYDVDGITATALCLDVLEAHGIEAGYHLPSRQSEGYGLNIPQIELAAAQGYRILLTVDCGISDFAAVARARELGMTVVISDHHIPSARLPPADAICNPRLPAAVPCPDLAGVGVAFYLMGALNAALERHTRKRYKMDAALDLVALGTLADVMPLTGENRILGKGGISHIAAAKRPGIAALKAVCDFAPAAALNSGQVVYRLAPRINAAGRMGQADIALQLLRTNDYDTALGIANQLDELNKKRKAEEERIHTEARAQARELLDKNPNSLVLFGADWHPGVIGIVASRIVEEFYRPTIIFCEDKGSLKGSGRSIHEFDLHAGLEASADCLENFGGHRLAAGLRLRPQRLEEFRKRFDAEVAARLDLASIKPSLELECELDFAHACDQRFIKEIDLLQPFGQENPEPFFASPPLLVQRHSFLGRSREHVLLQVQDKKSGISLRAKAWRMAEKMPPPSLEGQTILLAYSPRLDVYNGIVSVDLEIKDWKQKAGQH